MKKRRVDLQVSVTFAQLPAGYRPSLNAVHDALNYRIEYGKDAPGVTTRIIGWTSARGTRGTPSSQEQENHAWRRFRGMIQAGQVTLK